MLVSYYSWINKLENETLLFKPTVPETGALKTVLAFPNSYSIGITSLGYQIIWSTLAQRKDVDVRRLFTDQGDIQPRKIDLFGLSLSWELDGPVLLNLLERQNIPIWSDQRTEKDPLVFGGGAVLTANPEPFAPFFDVILLGDGEGLLPTFIDKLQEIKDLPRLERLQQLSLVDGIYIPSLYMPNYSNDGTLMSIKTKFANTPSSIHKQIWKNNSLSSSSVITPDAIWPNIHMVEVVRSCPELCRFCLASYLNLPFRTPSIEEGLIPAIEKGLIATNRIGLLGASVTQHPQFTELLNWLNDERFDDMQLSISSVRATTVNALMTKTLARRGCKSITIAIESGSQRIREVINKKLTSEEIFASAKYALEGGLKRLKLYGMVGVPTEEEEDIEATAELLIAMKAKTAGLQLTLGVSTFVPKAHTPFQWSGVRPEAKKRLKLLAKKLRPKGIEFRPESYGWSLIQTLISRSDRRLAPVIAFVKGSENTLGEWKAAYKRVLAGEMPESMSLNNSQPKPPEWSEVIFENWNINRVLPWHHLKTTLTQKQLIQHQDLALKQVKPYNSASQLKESNQPY